MAKYYLFSSIMNDAAHNEFKELHKHKENVFYSVNFFKGDSNAVSLETAIQNTRSNDGQIIILGRNYSELSRVLDSAGLRRFENYYPDWYYDGYEAGRLVFLRLWKSLTKYSYDILDCINYLKETQSLVLVQYTDQLSFIAPSLNKSFDCAGRSSIIVQLPTILENISEYEGFLHHLLLNCDYYLVQKSITFSEEVRSAIEKNLKSAGEKSMIITVPYLHYQGYFPQCTGEVYTILKKSKYGAEGLSIFVDQTLESITDSCVENVFIANNHDAEILEIHNQSLNSIKDEDDCTIKIFDFLHKNYKRHRLFNNPISPSDILCKYLFNEIWRIIDSESTSCFVSDGIINQVPIYSNVAKVLKLEFSDDKCIINSALSGRHLSLSQYYEYYTAVRGIYNECDSIIPIPVTLDLSSQIRLDRKYVSLRGPACLTLNNGHVHLSLYLNKHSNMPNCPVVSIPKYLAPLTEFIGPVHVNHGVTYPVTICNDGKIKINMNTSKNDSNEILIIDCSWNVA